ncbi:MAG: hypothetical protein QOF45_897 [Gaiellaceae bacterium]|jgi:hypothetical protein|nr:hypothetical protein [Gaiellaceae bacterium]
MLGTWSLAEVEGAKAYWFDFHVSLLIWGHAPNPGYTVEIQQSLLDVEPPGFTAQWRQRPGIWPQVIAPYTHQQTFKIGSRRETVLLHHSGGERRVEVEDRAPDVEAVAAVGVGEEKPLISHNFHPLSGEALPATEAVGYSDAWDVREAMLDAIRVLPPQNPNVADWLSHYEVVTMGAEIGGIAGFDRLFVHVRS